jgi:hypothetical protein
MAYWAEIDENNIVLRVTIGSDQEEDGGYQWLVDNLGGTWIQTYQDDTLNVKFASKDDIWDGTNFVTPIIETPTEQETI